MAGLCRAQRHGRRQAHSRRPAVTGSASPASTQATVFDRLSLRDDVLLVVADQVVGARKKRTEDDRIIIRIAGERRGLVGRERRRRGDADRLHLAAEQTRVISVEVGVKSGADLSNLPLVLVEQRPRADCNPIVRCAIWEMLGQRCSAILGVRNEGLGGLQATKRPPTASLSWRSASRSSWRCSASYVSAPNASRSQNLRGMPPDLKVAGSATLVSTVTNAKYWNLRRPADARPDRYESSLSAAAIFSSERAPCFSSSCRRLASEIVGAAQRGEERALRDPILASGQPQERDPLRFDPPTNRAVAHAQQRRCLGNRQQ